MNEKHIAKIAEELEIKASQVAATAELLADDATVPFIARYRKEATGGLDEVAITAIRDRLAQLKDLDDRREAIRKSLIERELLTDELAAQIDAAETMAELEDIYLPYRPKRRTRATIAKEKGLEPLADLLFGQEDIDPEAEAQAYVDAEKGVESADDALAGARDIIAERVNEDQHARATMREFFAENAMIKSAVAVGKEQEAAKYRDYFEWEEPAKTAPSHRVLAMLRGDREMMLLVRIMPPEDEAIAQLESQFVTSSNAAAEQVKQAVQDAYKRLLQPSMENEIRKELKKQADAEAIRVFAENLRELLLAPPLGQKNVLGLDPGFRTGCKLVCLDRQGKLVYDDVVYLTQSESKAQEGGRKIVALCEKFKIEAIAIGNGTASREAEAYVRTLDLPTKPIVVMVNESGASVYSASEAARDEFPDKDVTVRGAVSIGRRLADPLAELVKIDPKSIGVGQYQHDVDQNDLKRSLDDVVMSCVNAVGVEVNTASKQLLSYVSGLGPQLAGNILKHRNENGPFKSRKELLKVSRLGPKAFEQAAGFLRIRDAENPLDASAVHPESYSIVEAMASDAGCDLQDLMRNADIRNQIDLKKYETETVGLPTLTDILEELAKPGRDPRKQFEAFSFAEDVEKISDVQPGMKLPGIVTNVTAFGAFVDIGVHQDGLVHISELADRYVQDPAEIVKVHQHVQVRVLEVDLERNRISLSMKSEAPKPGTASRPDSDSKKQSGRSNDSPANGKGDRRVRPTTRPAPGRKGKAQNRPPKQESNWFLDALRDAEKQKREKEKKKKNR